MEHKSLLRRTMSVGGLRSCLSFAVEGATDRAFSPDGTLLAIARKGRRVELWRIADRALVRTFPGPESAQTKLTFSPSGTLLGISERGKISLWNISTGDAAGVIEGANLSPLAVAFSPDGTMLAAADLSGIQLKSPEAPFCGRWDVIPTR